MFPKHKELFTQEHLGSNDEDTYPDLEQNLGVLRRYKGKRQITSEEIMMDDFNNVRKNLDDQLSQTYAVDSTNDSSAMENTRNIIARLRAGRNPTSGLGEEFR